MDIICVESIDPDPGKPEARVMSWLQNEESADKSSSRRKVRKERTRTPGAMILLALFGLAVLTILIIGERNLFSNPVNFQTEPMANVGESRTTTFNTCTEADLHCLQVNGRQWRAPYSL